MEEILSQPIVRSGQRSAFFLIIEPKKKEKEQTLQLIDQLKSECLRLSGQQIIGQCCASRSQIYRWRQGQLERKPREAKQLPEATVENAAGVIAAYPHFSGRKGQAYMIYHRLGYIGMNAYDRIKHNVKRLLVQELGRRKAFSAQSA